MSTGTPVVIGFYPTTQSPVDERYLNNGVPWTDTAEVLANIPLGSRSAGLQVNVAGVLYWFLADLATLEPVVGTLTLADGSVTLVKMAAMDSLTVLGNATGASATPQAITIAALKVLLDLSGTNTGDQNLSTFVTAISGKGLSTNDLTNELLALLNQQSNTNTGDETETTILAKLGVDDVVQPSDLTGFQVGETGKSLVDNAEIERLAEISKIYRLILNASDDVDLRLVGLVEGTDFPTGWTLAADSLYNLKVTHNLTGRKCVAVKVWEIDGSTERLAKDFSDAYSGVSNTGLDVLIEGLDTIVLPLRIELIFS